MKTKIKKLLIECFKWSFKMTAMVSIVAVQAVEDYEKKAGEQNESINKDLE